MKTEYELSNGMNVSFTNELNKDGFDIVNVKNRLCTPLLFDRITQRFYQSGKGLECAFELEGVAFK